MQLFVLWLMMLATAAARVPVKGFLEGICHILYQSMASQKQSIKKITLFVCSYDIRYQTCMPLTYFFLSLSKICSLQILTGCWLPAFLLQCLV